MSSKPYRELEPNYVLNDLEKGAMIRLFDRITVDPYRQYETFMRQVGDIVRGNELPKAVCDVFHEYRFSDPAHHPFIFLANVPFDETVPVYSNTRAIHDKYEKKKTFYEVAPFV